MELGSVCAGQYNTCMSWIDHAIIYHIFIDRFSLPQSDPRALLDIPDEDPVFCGGNIRGVIERFSYLQALGVNTIWLSPFYKGDAFHGYQLTDFYTMDERFGTEADLRELIDLAHRNDMRVVVDFVPNHVSHTHPFFLDAKEDASSTYRDWFLFARWPTEYRCFLDVEVLPKLNLENSEARAHVIGAARKWLTLGLDGFRVDHIPGPSDDFWIEFHRTLKGEYPDAEFFGEAWMYNVRFKDLKTLLVGNKYFAWLFGTRVLMRHYKGIFRSLLDFEFNRLIREFGAAQITESQLRDSLQRHYKQNTGMTLVSFLDNHDMDRFMYVVGNDKALFKRCVEIQFALAAPLAIYQGSEFGMTHAKGFAEYAGWGDRVARYMVPWEQTPEFFDFYKEQIRKRKERDVHL